jgi:hypothetical protein
MAWLAEMGVSPTKPLSRRTTEFTFELDKVFSMLGAVLNRNITTVRTYQLFGVKSLNVLLAVHSLCTIFTPTEIWIFAFETLEIGIYRH